MKRQIRIYTVILLSLQLVACGKEFLDIKRNANQVVPISAMDYQAILDQESVMCRTAFFLNMIGSDEYETNDNFINALTPTNEWTKKAYTWQEVVFLDTDESMDWQRTYERILYANLALEVQKTVDDQDEINRIYGQALFHRAWNYYQLATTFCKAYYPSEAHQELGLPLRKDYDITQKPHRSTLKETYQFIENDLLEAEKLIAENEVNKFRADRSSTYALLAKVYLEMEEYEKALPYALAYLDRNSELLDFNKLEGLDQRYTFSQYTNGRDNPEVLLFLWNTTAAIIANSRHDMKNTLLPLYEPFDLRRQAFFFQESDGRITFKGSYTGNAAYFTGISTAEMMLVAAECHARQDQNTLAIEMLNKLLSARYDEAFYKPLIMSDFSRESLLRFVIEERQRELCWRGTRWADIKRYNKELSFEKRLRRDMLGVEYTIEPHDDRWAWPLPNSEIIYGKVEQNPR